MKMMQVESRLWILAVGLLLMAGATSTQAQRSGPYLKVDGGVNLMPDNDVRVGPNNGTLSLDAGYRVDAVVGYDVGRWLAFEVEGGYAENSVDKLTSAGLPLSGHSNSSLRQIPVLANVVVRYENRSDWVPYIGAGAGGIFSSLKISGTSEDDTVFAWQAKAGVIYKIDENAWLDLNYKLLMAGEQAYQFGSEPLKTDQMLNHFFGLSVIWKF